MILKLSHMAKIRDNLHIGKSMATDATEPAVAIICSPTLRAIISAGSLQTSSFSALVRFTI